MVSQTAATASVDESSGEMPTSRRMLRSRENLAETPVTRTAAKTGGRSLGLPVGQLRGCGLDRQGNEGHH